MKPNRSGTLDTLRGLTLLSMMAYHGCWDLVYLRGLPWSWYHGFWAYVWQQSICCTFILLSGYCWQMGRHPLRRGLMSFGGGLAVSLVTALAMPEDPVRFGVLTFLGTAMLLTVPLRRWLDRVPPRLGLAGAFGLFLLVRNINDGFLGFAGVPILMLPRSWYANLFTAGLGFPGPASCPRTIFPCCRGCCCSGPGIFSTGCGPQSRCCRISASLAFPPWGGIPCSSIFCTSRCSMPCWCCCPHFYKEEFPCPSS